MDLNFKQVIKQRVAIGLIIFSAAACLPDPLEVQNIPVVRPEIVVSSQLIPERGLVVFLTRTIGALDASNQSDPQSLLTDIAVTDAVVNVQHGAETFRLDSIGTGVYGGINIPFIQGDQYRLVVESTTLGRVEATTSVLATVPFDFVQADLFYNGFNDTLAQVSYRIQDPASANYYMVNVQEVEREDAVENLINPRAFTSLIDDQNFNGEVFEDSFRVFPRDYQPGDTIAVTLSNISQEYYDFVKLRIDNRFSFVEFLGEPVNYPSNVIGGRGFFNLYVPDVRIFILEE